MTSPEPAAQTESRYRVPGEGLAVPFSVAISLGGLLCAAAAVYLALDARSARQPVAVVQVQAGPASSPRFAGDQERQRKVKNDAGAFTAASREGVSPAASQPSSAAGQAPPKRSRTGDCPPLFAVKFGTGQTEPLGYSQAQVGRLQEWLAVHQEAQLVVNGHADASGSTYRNFVLSRDRANRLREVFVARGVSPARIIVRAFGEFVPLAGVPEDSADNRRATLAVRGAGACP